MKKIISIIIPVYNEEDTIFQVLDRLVKLKLDGLTNEIIVVDDCSKDNTKKILEKFKNKIILICHNKNKGKGYAIRTGLEYANGDIITIQDADLEYNMNDFKELIKPILSGESKVVYGSRFLKNNEKGHSLFYIANRTLSFITSILYLFRITDMETCYKVFDSKVLKDIKLDCSGFEFEPEITAKILKKGYKIKEIPIDYMPRLKSEGKKIKIKDGFIALKTLIKYRLIN